MVRENQCERPLLLYRGVGLATSGCLHGVDVQTACFDCASSSVIQSICLQMERRLGSRAIPGDERVRAMVSYCVSCFPRPMVADPAPYALANTFPSQRNLEKTGYGGNQVLYAAKPWGLRSPM